MKRIMVALFAVCAAVAAQAAYVDWQYEGKNAKNDYSWGTSTTEAANGYTAYLLTEAAWNGFKDAQGNISITGTDALASAALDSSTLIWEKTTKSVAYYTTHADGADVAGVRQVEAASGNFYIVIANDDGYSVVADGVAITAYNDPTQVGTGQTAGLVLTAQSNATAITGAASSFAVPEPTSGLLMLVGLGALALRRRRA